MARLMKARCRKSRRCGTDLELTSGMRDNKYRKSRPGGVPPGRTSDYGEQLRMKQTIRFYYGIMEKQFRNYYKKADKAKGSTADNLLVFLESRLDNVVYRMGYACTRSEARQMIGHKHILVNGKLVSMPSYHVNPGDKVEIREKARKNLRIQNALGLHKEKTPMSWIDTDAQRFVGIFEDLPKIAELPSIFKIKFVVELYSK
jgi:small subunit ribosomal protein S4